MSQSEWLVECSMSKVLKTFRITHITIGIVWQELKESRKMLNVLRLLLSLLPSHQHCAHTPTFDSWHNFCKQKGESMANGNNNSRLHLILAHCVDYIFLLLLLFSFSTCLLCFLPSRQSHTHSIARSLSPRYFYSFVCVSQKPDECIFR